MKKILWAMMSAMVVTLWTGCKDEEEKNEIENSGEGGVVVVPSYFDKIYAPKVDGTPEYTIKSNTQRSGKEMETYVLTSPLTKELPEQYVPMISMMMKSANDVALKKVKEKTGRTDAEIAYKDLIIYYKSETPDGKDVTLSGRAVIGGYVADGRFNSIAEEILVAIPYTRTENEICATEALPIETLVGPSTIVVVPDLLGYGASKDKPTPYLFNETAGKEGYELALATVDYMNANGLVFSSDLKTYTCGASQGGAYSVAVQKMMEGKYPKMGEALRFSGSFVACGAFSPLVTFTEFSTTRKDEEFGEPAALPLLYLAGKEYYAEETMDVKAEDVMRGELVRSGILDTIMTKRYSSGFVNKMIKNACGDSTFASMAAETFVEGDGAYTAFKRIFEKESTLLEGWTPKADIKVMFSETDESIPFENYTALKDAFGEKVERVPVDANTHAETVIKFYLELAGRGYRK